MLTWPLLTSIELYLNSLRRRSRWATSGAAEAAWSARKTHGPTGVQGSKRTSKQMCYAIAPLCPVLLRRFRCRYISSLCKSCDQSVCGGVGLWGGGASGDLNISDSDANRLASPFFPSPSPPALLAARAAVKSNAPPPSPENARDQTAEVSASALKCWQSLKKTNQIIESAQGGQKRLAV